MGRPAVSLSLQSSQPILTITEFKEVEPEWNASATPPATGTQGLVHKNQLQQNIMHTKKSPKMTSK